MKKLLHVVPAIAILITTSIFAAQPAFALPTCEQEIRIRCSGYEVQGRERLDIYYDSYEECVAAETPAQCGTAPSFSSLNGRAEDVAGGHVRAKAYKV